MKTIEEAVYEMEHTVNGSLANAFLRGINFAQSWIPVDSELPEEGIEVLFKSDKWINEDYNPNGTRIGFYNGDWYTTAYWCNYQDCYMERTSDEDDDTFEDSLAINQIPTHWKLIK